MVETPVLVVGPDGSLELVRDPTELRPEPITGPQVSPFGAVWSPTGDRLAWTEQGSTGDLAPATVVVTPGHRNHRPGPGHETPDHL